MFWRRTRRDWEAAQGAGNRRAFRNLVTQGPPPGLIAYGNGEPVGWCALAPRTQYVGLTRSRVLKPVDDQPVWSISCFFVRRDWRRRGVTIALLDAAATFARRHGADVLEGYPVDTRGKLQPAAFVWHGTLESFSRAGFHEVARRSPTRPIMRRVL